MSGTTGQQNFASDLNDVNSIAFAVKQSLARVQTAMPVMVISCTNAGGLTPVGYVDVQPLVNMTDGAGNATPHGIIHNLPYCRWQGGQNAIIMDPAANDIGVAVFASRDISSVKANKAPSNPGSFRRHDFSDGMYVAGTLNGTPTQYIQFNSAGITVTSPTSVTINAPTISLNGNVATTGTLTNNGHLVGSTHMHLGVTPGSGETGVPV